VHVVDVVDGSGSYSFDVSIFGSTNLQFTCLVVSASGQSDVETLSVTSTGTYHNTVCGTGSADSTNTAITATRLGLPGTTDLTGNWTGKDLSYHIQFVAGQGALVFKNPANLLFRGMSNAFGGGEVTITPDLQRSDLAANICTNSFKVTGALAGDI
jgi:hypothetical protein